MNKELTIVMLFMIGFICNPVFSIPAAGNIGPQKILEEWTLVTDVNSKGKLGFSTVGKKWAAHITYDVSTGGRWVGAQKNNVKITGGTVGFSFRVKCSGASTVWVYITDSMQNRFEFRLCRSLTEMNETKWQRRFLSFSALPDSVRGVNARFNKKNIQSIAIVIEPRMDPWYPSLRWIPQPKGEMWFSDIRWVANYNEPIELISNSTITFPSKKLWDKTGVCALPDEKDFKGEYAIPTVGFSIFRDDLHWSGVERIKGIYDFSEYDKLVATAEAHGMRTLLILDYSNELYCKGGLAPVTREQINAYSKFCAEAARFFKGRKVDFEIWNEPNFKPFWKPMPNALHYANLIRPAIDSVRKANPGVKIISGGTAGIDWRFIDSVGLNGGLKGLDGIGFHPYRKGSPESFSDDLACLRWVTKRYLKNNLPEWATEYGASSSWYGNGLQDSALLWQARIDVRAMLANWIAGFAASMKYSLYAQGDSTNDEHNYGILWQNVKPRPGYHALKALRNFTENRDWKGQLSCTNPNAYVLQFDGKKDRVLILWTSAANKEKDVAGYATRFQLAQKPIAVYNYLGKQMPVTEKQNGKWVIEAGGEVVYAILPK